MPGVRAARRAGCDEEIVELLVHHGAEALAEGDDPGALVGAAGAGDNAAVARLLDLGIPIATRGSDGETALHAAAFAGRVSTLRLLIERGAELDARDTTWQSSPLDWAREGCSRRTDDEPETRWDETARRLIEAGATPEDV